MNARHRNEAAHRVGVRVVGLVGHLLRGEEQRELYLEVAAACREEMAVEDGRAAREKARLVGHGPGGPDAGRRGPALGR